MLGRAARAPRPTGAGTRPASAIPSGEVAEWSKAPHSKCGVRATVPWVRIPPSPPARVSELASGLRGLCPIGELGGLVRRHFLRSFGRLDGGEGFDEMVRRPQRHRIE